MDTENPSRALGVEFFVDGEVVYRDVANLERADVGRMYGSSRHGFSFGVSEYLRKEQNMVDLKVVGEQFRFSKVPLSLQGSQKRYVEVGRDGWLFLKNDSNDTVGLVEGRRALSSNGALGLANMFKGRLGLYDRLGVRGISYVVPEKSVCLDWLRPGAQPASPDRPIIQILKSLRECGVNSLHYPEFFFGARSERVKLFFKTDTHFSPYGRLMVFRDVMKHLGLNEPPMADLVPVKHVGDLGSKLTPVVVEDTVSYVASEGIILCDEASDALKNKTKLRGSRVVTRNEMAEYNNSLLIFGTSSSYFIRGLFSQYFRDVTFCWFPVVMESMIRDLRPDYVVNIISERFIFEGMEDDLVR